MLISSKKIRFLANKKWDNGKKWCDANRDILRDIYSQSSKTDRKINLQFFCECAGIELSLAWRIGQLDQYRDDQKRRKYGQSYRREEIPTDEIIETFSAITAGTGRKTRGGGTTSIATGQFFGA